MVDFNTYENIAAAGQMARGRIGGALRGGWSFEGRFYAVGGVGKIYDQSVESTHEFELITNSISQVAE